MKVYSLEEIRKDILKMSMDNIADMLSITKESWRKKEGYETKLWAAELMLIFKKVKEIRPDITIEMIKLF